MLGKALGPNYRYEGLKSFLSLLGPLEILFFGTLKYLVLNLLFVFVLSYLAKVVELPFVLVGLAKEGTIAGLSVGERFGLSVFLTAWNGAFSSDFIDSAKETMDLERLYRFRLDRLYDLHRSFIPWMEGACRAVAYLILSIYAGLWPGWALLAALSIPSLSLAVEPFYIHYFERTGQKASSRHLWLFVLVRFIFVPAVLIVAGLWRVDFLKLTAYLAPVFVFFWWYRQKKEPPHPSFARLHSCLLQAAYQEQVDSKKIAEEMDDTRVQGEKKDLRKRPYTSKRQGYGYLNDLFFHRYAKPIFWPILLKAGILSIVSLGSVLFLPLGLWQELLPLCPFYIPLLMYLSCLSSNLTGLLYKACDEKLAHYAFFKEGSAILSLFFYRLQTMVKLHALAAGLVLVPLFLLGFRLAAWSALWPVILLGLLWALFFTLYPFFFYYVLGSEQKDSRLRFLMPFCNMLLYLAVFFYFPRLAGQVAGTDFLLFTGAILLAFFILMVLLLYFYLPRQTRRA